MQAPMPSAVKWVVIDAGEAMTHMDYTAARILQALKKKNLTEAGVELAFARVPWDLRSPTSIAIT